MKEILKNKRVLISLLSALIVGVFIGWLMAPSGPHEKEETSLSEHQHSEEETVWTCSMHPQIRKSEPGQCPICGMDLIPATSGRSGASDNPLVYEMTPEAVAMANVQTSRVTGISTEGEMFLTGKVSADERQIGSITAKFPGRIEKLNVNFTGEKIQKGERLATIYSPELVTAQKELLEAASTKETFPELYAAAREKLRLWKLNEAQINQIENKGSVQEQFNVLADKSGVVTRRNVAVGDYVNTGSVLFQVVDLSKVWIMIDAYESDLPYIKVGDEIAFTAAGIPGQTFTARVTFIDPVIDPDTRSASVRAEAVNKNGNLMPEMFVNARIRTTLHQGESSLAIPRTALLWSGKRSIVYVKVPDAAFPAYEMREITIGPRMGDMYLVEEGLEAGEEIVTNGVFAIDAAAQLAGNYSMLSRPEPKTMEVPLAFREQITRVADDYFQLKNAFVESNIQTSTAAAKDLQVSLEEVEMQHLKGPAHDHWMELRQQLAQTVGMILKAENLEARRKHFSMLSGAVVEMTESFGLEKAKVYKDYCPMAFDNKGAFWLSEVEEIRNPYFGDAMLSCGEIQETYLRGQTVYEKGGPAAPQSGGHEH